MLEKLSQLEVGKTYVLESKKGTSKVVLKEIKRSASGLFPADYIFSHAEGEEPIFNDPEMFPDFHLPEGLVDKLIRIENLKDI